MDNSKNIWVTDWGEFEIPDEIFKNITFSMVSVIRYDEDTDTEVRVMEKKADPLPANAELFAWVAEQEAKAQC